MTFALKDRDKIVPTEAKDISFAFSGTPSIVWSIDTGKIIDSLLGKSKKEFRSILAGFPNIDSAEVVLKPFWRTTFPNKASDLTVKTSFQNL